MGGPQIYSPPGSRKFRMEEERNEGGGLMGETGSQRSQVQLLEVVGGFACRISLTELLFYIKLMCHPPEKIFTDPTCTGWRLEASCKHPQAPLLPSSSAVVLMVMSLSARHSFSGTGTFWVISTGSACGPLEGTPWTLVRRVC